MQKTYTVKRVHECDMTTFNPGGTREADSATVKHLVDLGVLEEVRSDTPTANKAERAAPKNKAG